MFGPRVALNGQDTAGAWSSPCGRAYAARLKRPTVASAVSLYIAAGYVSAVPRYLDFALSCEKEDQRYLYRAYLYRACVHSSYGPVPAKPSQCQDCPFPCIACFSLNIRRGVTAPMRVDGLPRCAWLQFDPCTMCLCCLGLVLHQGAVWNQEGPRAGATREGCLYRVQGTPN